METPIEHNTFIVLRIEIEEEDYFDTFDSLLWPRITEEISLKLVLLILQKSHKLRKVSRIEI